MLRNAGSRRAVLPVIWAHHDDGNYLGRPYTPFDRFATRLADANACGFGIIHWTTRPLDLFFISHARQVWAGSQDEPLDVTCREMAARSFGPSTRDQLGEYLRRWVTEAPKFARETGNLFMDRPLNNLEEVLGGCRERLKLLAAVDSSGLTLEQRDRVKYFQGLEEFTIAIHQTQAALQRSQALLKAGDLAGARTAVAECHPEEVVGQYARFSSLGGISRGEQGMVIALNLHWLTHYVQQRQALGLAAVRYHFAPTSHEQLAQTPGLFTYHVDADHQLWQTLGAKETGARAFALAPERKVTLGEGQPEVYREMCRAGLEGDQPIRLTLGPIMGKATLARGDYRLHVLMLDPTSTAAGQRVFNILVSSGTPASTQPAAAVDRSNPTEPPSLNDRVDIFQATGRANQVLERSYPVAVGPAGTVTVQLTPLEGTAVVSAMILEPIESPRR